MARIAASCNVASRSTTGVATLGTSGGCADVVNGATVATTQAALVAAMAVLVADAASPTQAHVTTADAALTAYLADVAQGRPVNTDVVISVDVANVVTHSALRKAVRRIELIFEGSNALTP